MPRPRGQAEEDEDGPPATYGAVTGSVTPPAGGPPDSPGDLAGLIARWRDRWCIRREDGMYRAYGRACDEDGAVTYTGTEVAASSIAALDGELAAREDRS